jgi:hypothetical protein
LQENGHPQPLEFELQFFTNSTQGDDMFTKLFKSVAIAASAFAVLSVVSTPAEAQKGRRACGVVGEVGGVAVMGVLQDRNKNENGRICNKIIDEMEKELRGKPETASMTLVRIHKDTCESVGERFKAANYYKDLKKNDKKDPPDYQSFPDICDLMEAEKTYIVSRAPNDKKIPIFSIKRK